MALPSPVAGVVALSCLWLPEQVRVLQRSMVLPQVVQQD